MSLQTEPLRLGGSPVYQVERAGVHKGVVVMQLRNSVPLEANLSILGVLGRFKAPLLTFKDLSINWSPEAVCQCAGP